MFFDLGKSLDRKVDKELWAIKVGDELRIVHQYCYNNDNSRKRDVDIGCIVTNISGTGNITVVLCDDRGERKIISLLRSLESWLLDCEGVPIISDVPLEDWKHSWKHLWKVWKHNLLIKPLDWIKCTSPPIMYRNKTDRRLRGYIFVKREGVPLKIFMMNIILLSETTI
jgi:hypothetical protein